MRRRVFELRDRRQRGGSQGVEVVVGRSDDRWRHLVESATASDTIEAAAVLDASGTPIRIAGNSDVFRHGESSSSADELPGTKDVYVSALAADRYLVVAFDSGDDFERVKEELGDVLDDRSS